MGNGLRYANFHENLFSGKLNKCKMSNIRAG